MIEAFKKSFSVEIQNFMIENYRFKGVAYKTAFYEAFSVKGQKDASGIKDIRFSCVTYSKNLAYFVYFKP